MCSIVYRTTPNRMVPVPNAQRGRYTGVTTATSTAWRRRAPGSSSSTGGLAISREALAELGNAIYNEVTPISHFSLGRYTYLNVVQGSTLCAFVKRYFRERRRVNLTSSQVLDVCRSLVAVGVVSVVDEERNYRTRQFENNSNCLCRIRRTSRR